MKIKVIFYMKSGNSFSFKCDSFRMNKLSGNESREFNWENANKTLSFDVLEVEAVTFKKVIF